MLEKLEYYICLFLYGLKEKEQVSKNTLFRYVYIFDVVNDYLGNFEKINDEIILDKDMGLGNVVQLTEALNEISRRTLMSRIDNKTNELLRGLSDELNSIFDGVEMNDMKCWGTAS